MSKYTWEYEPLISKFVILSFEGKIIGTCYEKNQAEFIVRACACHDEFLKLCEEIRSKPNDLDYEIKQRLNLIVEKSNEHP